MKDLDSFTEGTGQGSFDFLLPLTATEEGLPLIFHPPDNIDHMEHSINRHPNIMMLPANPLALELLPSPSNLEDAVLAWRENVVNYPFPMLELPVKKRRRSHTLDGDDEERHIRVWSPSPQSSPMSHIDAKESKQVQKEKEKAKEKMGEQMDKEKAMAMQNDKGKAKERAQDLMSPATTKTTPKTH